MNFRTELNTSSLGIDFNYQSNYLSMGSCFADEIGNKLAQLKFDILVNPAGIVFNPISLAIQFKNAVQQQVDRRNFVRRENKFFSYDYHSKINGVSDTDLFEKIGLINQQTLNSIKTAKCIFITFGTAWIYQLIESKKIVANCHKINQAHFSKRLLTIDECFNAFEKIIQQVNNINPHLNWVFTVSPVRHLKDGLYENNLSKSVLHMFVNQLVSSFKNAHYFPAYEFLLDDLRDYRFYKKDLIHPNEIAVDYIFEKFETSFFTAKTRKAVLVQQQILQLQNHQSIIENDLSVQEKITKLQNEFELLIK